MDYDFSGYATRANLRCSDGRIIRKDAFSNNDGQVVPLVWQHLHNDPANVLGHALLENRDDGVYAYCKFNNTESAKNSKELVGHGDINSLSIYANRLIQKGPEVTHGEIKEVSLVLSGANPGALIDNLTITHSDGSYDTDETEAIIYTGQALELDDEDDEGLEHIDGFGLEHSKGEGKTIADIFNTLTEEQKNVVYAMIAQAISDQTAKHSDEGGDYMKTNVFDREGDDNQPQNILSHSDIQAILEDGPRFGSLRESFLAHLDEMEVDIDYGIENIDFLFPDHKNLTKTPTFIKRKDDWVAGVINGVHHSPFSRIKSTHADITADEARAKGYVTGEKKVEEVIKLLRRVTSPTTIYKKQKLDRDDIVDITDFEVVSWLKAEMRMMLDEEIARAILVGDGRTVVDPDKIDEDCIRPIYKEDTLYAHQTVVAANAKVTRIIEDIIRSRKHYRGSGAPVLYTTPDILTDMLLVKDKIGRRLYNTEAELASALRVSRIVEVAVMEGLSREVQIEDEGPVIELDLIGIIVNLNDYVVGADKGGEVNMFDDFDIDYNQYKYLMETRCSGALRIPKSAIIVEQKQPEGGSNGNFQ